MFGPEKEEKALFSKLHNEKLYYTQSSTNVRVITWGRVRMTGHSVSMR